MSTTRAEAPAPTDPEPGLRTHPRDLRSQVIGAVERFAVPALLLVLVAVFSLQPATAERFPTQANIQNLLAGQAVLGIAALAVLIPIIAGQYDLSVGAILGASSLLSAGLMAREGLPPPIAIGIAIAAGVLIGAINGIIVAHLEVNSLIVTTGSATVIAGFVLWYSDSQTIVGIPKSITDAIVGEWLHVPKLVYALAATALLVYVVLQHTPYGRYLHAIGSNARASRLVGLGVPRLTVSALMFSGGLAACAGVAQLGLQGSASPQLGPGFTLPALSAVFLGSTAIKPGKFNVLGTLFAVYLVAVIVNGLTLAGASDWVQPTFNGLALLGAVVLAALVARSRRRGPTTSRVLTGLRLKRRTRAN
ncbi:MULTISPECIES: ABC transporter permease [unclassified Rhodococcus (in: high G+C Gram-positive bacteria)]|uniref:ABC transporter permease n=1 Tax=unclassified Rhodococcus (in: high G+C Gram-positive bacteria) TaxID=192944 RepID=UPI0015C5E968|nr:MULTISPECIES: ABC transporter permease [unclassified Rhodococcus (in: high G+C Gram-positive bacteria)]